LADLPRRLADALLAALADPRPDTPYARGVRDALRLLGLLQDDDRPTGEITGMVVDTLRAHLQDGVTVGFDWESRGVDWLRIVETARLAAVPHPTPARVTCVTQAVIKRRVAGDDLYLMQYDALAGQFQPLGGKQDVEDPDSAFALRREIAEELGLVETLSTEACGLSLLVEGWTTAVLSATYGLLTHYTFDVYHVTHLEFEPPTDHKTCWLTRAAILAGRAADGRAITDLYQQALGIARLDALPPTLVK
jgi:8-oxo-dGTP pyrophosphatase MutT (NUDIX family)